MAYWFNSKMASVLFAYMPGRARILYLVLAAIIMTALSLAAIAPAYVSAAPAAVVNPGLEQSTGSVPTCFSQSGWGQHTASWSLVPGRS
ncbi:MAG TPA: hypothetical protein VK983_02940, partial [Candidatus Limnocylindrales bacterium]|nr:hypothetical protein [Candidatus Limnocylindrales bacterium]